MKTQQFPEAWDQQRVKQLIAELDARTDEEWVAAAEAAAADADDQTVITPCCPKSDGSSHHTRAPKGKLPRADGARDELKCVGVWCTPENQMLQTWRTEEFCMSPFFRKTKEKHESPKCENTNPAENSTWACRLTLASRGQLRHTPYVKRKPTVR